VHLAGVALVAFDGVRDTGSHRPLSSPRARSSSSLSR
jgi:hypothetical protein